jgi:hypothetical protein
MRSGFDHSSAVILTTPEFSSASSTEIGDEPFTLPLELVVEDREVIHALLAHGEGEQRNQFALDALKIGVLALRHTNGQATADLVQREVRGMQQALELHVQHMNQQLAGTLREYFDPTDGRFSHRVKELVTPDGELAQLIRSHIDGENSHLARTLLAHMGASSPLMKQLDPQQSEGLLSVIRQLVEGQLTAHGKRVVNEFSLDNKDGALARLVGELTAKHGDLAKTVGERIDEVIKEFSLDKPDSALSRLVQNVDRAQRTITDEFSLDSKTSCLSRLKEELVTILAAHVKTNAEFQQEVKGALRELTARREEQARSTLHGGTFQSAVFEYLHNQSQQLGDICEFTGDRVGAIKNCKVGDVVVKLGADSAAAGACIVYEAKEDRSYSIARALEEMERARKNWCSDVGVFIFSKKTAPGGLRSLRRFGNDIVVVWDADDALTDAFLSAAHELARLMCLCRQRQIQAESADFSAIEKAILEIEKRAKNLDKICTYAKTIQNAGGKVLKRATLDRRSLERQAAVLRGKFLELRDNGGPAIS